MRITLLKDVTASKAELNGLPGRGVRKKYKTYPEDEG